MLRAICAGWISIKREPQADYFWGTVTNSCLTPALGIRDKALLFQCESIENGELRIEISFSTTY
jgi:hypothetical protein